MTRSKQTPSRNRSFLRALLRRKLIMPAEHGSWSWLLVPFGVGAGVAGRFTLPALLALVGGLAAFLMRQPATVWLRVRRGRARTSDGPLALTWLLLLAGIGLLNLLGLIALGRMALLWLLGPFLLILALYLLAARFGRSRLRSLWMEIAGAAALSMMAPAAHIAATGQLTTDAWTLWGIMATQNVLGALYVRLRIFDTHGRPIRRTRIWLAHLLGLLLILILGLESIAPLLTAVPFTGFLIRAIWAARTPRPVANVKRFGFTELGVEIASGIWIIAGYWLPPL